MTTVQTKGLMFPLELVSGKHVLVEGIDLIQASIKIIIAWPLFVRFYEGNFGSRIYEVLEEPNDDILVNLIRRFVIDAITQWEKRVELKSLTIERVSSENVSIELVYNIKESNIEGSFYYNYPLN